MYISRMALNGARRSAMEIIASPNKMHAAIEASFPPIQNSSLGGFSDCENDGVEGRVLWRIDPIPGKGRSAWLCVVSPRRPDLTHLCEQAGWPAVGGWETKNYEPRLSSLAEGQFCQFRLKANPVRKVRDDKGRTSNPSTIGTIQGHVTVQQQMDWLVERSERNGFRICTGAEDSLKLAVSQRNKLTFGHSGSKATLATAVFDGMLEVTDADSFRSALCCGIGRAKAFGCGLMTIVPVQQAFREES